MLFLGIQEFAETHKYTTEYFNLYLDFGTEVESLPENQRTMKKIAVLFIGLAFTTLSVAQEEGSVKQLPEVTLKDMEWLSSTKKIK